MIKLIAFDFVGVLAHEKDLVLTNEEENLERLFGPNISDKDYLEKAKNITKNDELEKLTKVIIDKIYEITDKDIFTKIKESNKNIKLVIATNHLSYIKEYIYKNFDTTYLDDIIISADINLIKPDKSFYKYVLNKYKIKPNEMLFLDDNEENINSAKDLGINTIKVNERTSLLKEINNCL